MGKTGISWTDRVWNPVTGCNKISAGCKNCYAKTVHDMRHEAYKAGKRVPEQYAVPFEKVMLHYNRLKLPNWKKPQRVFVNSMSDLFHEDVPDGFISEVFGLIAVNKNIFQILTKRADRMSLLLNNNEFRFKSCLNAACRTWELYESIKTRYPFNNLWLGVTAENQAAADQRIPILLDTPAVVRWVSIEPMLEGINIEKYIGNFTLRCDCGFHKSEDELCYYGGPYYVCPKCDAKCDLLPALNWVVVGCESGKNRRPCKIEWIESIVQQCKGAGVSVFVKQIEIGGKVVKDINQFPQHLQIQEFPR